MIGRGLGAEKVAAFNTETNEIKGESQQDGEEIFPLQTWLAGL